MQKKHKKKFFKFAAIVIFLSLFMFASNVFYSKCNAIEYKIADSGHGVSHHSSHSSSHHSSSRSSSGSRTSLADSNVNPIIIVLIVLIPNLIIIIAIIYGVSRGKRASVKPIDEDSIINRIKQYIPDFDKQKFLDNGYKIYIDVQNAWMNFKLDDVKNVITDELYNMYDAQLEIMKSKNEQNVMSGFNKVNASIKDFSVQNNTIAVTAVYVVEFYDYIINKQSGKVTAGTNSRKLCVTYEMTYRKTLNKDGESAKCPNCGGKIDYINGAGICKYCGSKIVSENSGWVLTNKKVIRQI